MSKYIREFSNSKIYHIIIKGIDESTIFYDDEDRNVFLNKLKVTKKKFKYKILAYCLMNNHVHLVISIENENLSKGIQSLIIRYASYFNRKYDRKGPFVQNRFNSKKVESQRYFLEVCRYVHRNPEKAGIEKTDKYKWSSYHEYIGKEKIIDRRFLMHYLGNDINNFTEYTTKKESKQEVNRLAEFEMIRKLSDDIVIKIILEKFKFNSVDEIINYFKNEKNYEKIKVLKEIQGTNPTQIRRIIRVSRRLIEKHWR
ncbi:MAG TPA: hypothetical protein DEP51_07025 [Clostridiales bacterium]|nr:hypothetical protein [Clostridiales bacterium]